MRYLLIDSNRGIYIPKSFVESYDLKAWHINDLEDEVADCAAGPDNANYWDSWDRITNVAWYQESKDKTKFYLECNEYLFANDYADEESES